MSNVTVCSVCANAAPVPKRQRAKSMTRLFKKVNLFMFVCVDWFVMYNVIYPFEARARGVGAQGVHLALQKYGLYSFRGVKGT